MFLLQKKKKKINLMFGQILEISLGQGLSTPLCTAMVNVFWKVKCLRSVSSKTWLWLRKALISKRWCTSKTNWSISLVWQKKNVGLECTSARECGHYRNLAETMDHTFVYCTIIRLLGKLIEEFMVLRIPEQVLL